ncbi:MAG: helix-turn-helix domain-containing protein [Candidatus Devosia phytovorans]|uniref:Helix-turn-helix domain-containing protein n=1 Tax=Candidatus Devosia phytovorans TaxID=3121372 RepID=A0AAJ6AYJ4_9HYPH|nr:helix-turn-helix domain-containing protein [Devosia sp.]WEK03650.1 MAG: helix-turn-helix domain-containing protein [Devosia sp.]
MNDGENTHIDAAGLRAPDVERAQELLALTGEAWTGPVVTSLKGRTARFNVLRSEVPGIAQKQLTRTLRQLERDGFVERTAYYSIPPRVEYQLTDLGDELFESMAAIGRLAVTRHSQIAAARQRFDHALFENRAIAMPDVQLR